jgi:hypothetical protein
VLEGCRTKKELQHEKGNLKFEATNEMKLG